MNDLDERFWDLFKRDLSASELEAARSAVSSGEGMDSRKRKRLRRNAILVVRRRVTGYGERHRRRQAN